MKKKGLAVILMAVLVMALLCGCSTDLTMSINEDGSGSVTQTVMIEKEYLADGSVTLDKTFTYEDVTEKGKAYRKGTKTITFQDVSSIPEMEDEKIVFNKDSFSMKSGSELLVASNSSTGMTDEELKEIMQYNITVTFPYEVKKTNGTIQADQKTVIWDNDQMYENFNCWAVFSDAPLDTSIAAPKLTGAKNKGYYKKDVTVKAVSDTVIDTFTVNGRVIGADGCYITQEGKTTVACTDINGKTTKISFVVDKTKPTVKGVANGKTYTSAKKIQFSDKYGVKSATLNGKKISTGKTVSKKGSYKLVVTDKAGNQKVIKFKLK